MKNIAIFASGTGTNAQQIIHHFANKSTVKVALVISNKPDAKVLDRAINANVPTAVFTKKDFFETDKVLACLHENKIDWIILAGFLLLIPDNLIKAFPKRIINIHPALLPKYGGAGMYGMKVHEAIVLAKEIETGITIHYVNEHYDEGEIVFQATCEVDETDTPEAIAGKVHILEHRHYPRIIEKLLNELNNG